MDLELLAKYGNITVAAMILKIKVKKEIIQELESTTPLNRWKILESMSAIECLVYMEHLDLKDGTRLIPNNTTKKEQFVQKIIDGTKEFMAENTHYLIDKNEYYILDCGSEEYLSKKITENSKIISLDNSLEYEQNFVDHTKQQVNLFRTRNAMLRIDKE